MLETMNTETSFEYRAASRIVRETIQPFLRTSDTAAAALGEVLAHHLVTPPGRDGFSREAHDVLRGLVDITSLQRQLLVSMDQWAREARAKGASWLEVGAAAGISKQAAQQRWGSPPVD